MSNNESDSDTGYNTPAEVAEAAKAIEENLLPSKSKEKYETIYKKFMEWRDNHKLESLSEAVFLVYFNEKKKDFKPSTFWAQYSIFFCESLSRLSKTHLSCRC